MDHTYAQIVKLSLNVDAPHEKDFPALQPKLGVETLTPQSNGMQF